MKNLRIGLTMRVTQAQGYVEPRDSLAQDWPPFMHTVMSEAAWMPIPNVGQRIVQYINDWKLNAFIITGGNNLFERPERDETEITVIKYAIEHNLPILGVCRGFQIMAHYFGYKITPGKGHAGTRHEVILQNTPFPWSKNTLTVNSYHENCGSIVSQFLESTLTPFAQDKDGHVEGFYHKYKPLMAVMWHPEREKTVVEFDKIIIRNFFGLNNCK